MGGMLLVSLGEWGGHEWRRGPSNPVRPRDASALSGLGCGRMREGGDE